MAHDKQIGMPPQRVFAHDPISYVHPSAIWVLARARRITDKEFAL
jgi:hypothetical protein